MALDWQPMQIPLVAGLDQKSEARASQPPNLEVCKDVQFDEIGGLQTRYPFAAIGSSVVGGGTISTARRIYANGTELILFDKDTLYSWNAQLSKWVSRGTHLAIKVTETPRFVTTGDQVDCDRAEMSNTIMYSWSDAIGLWAAALDKTTGGVIVAPTLVESLGTRGRLIALSTKIVLIWRSGAGANPLVALAIDPADVSTGLAAASTTVLAGASFNLYYDAVKIPSADTAIIGARRATTTAYSIIKLTAALAVSSATPGRTCDGPIAVSCTPDGASVQVVRANGTNIQGDLITISSLADVYTGQAVGTVSSSCKRIAAAHRSVQNSGQYRCYAFFSDVESATTASCQVKYNWVDSGNSLGTQATFVNGLGVASRAVDYNGSVYLWTVFALDNELLDSATQAQNALQNTYFLYRDDALLCGAALPGACGGFNASVGHTPGLVLTSGSTTFSWCGVRRRIIDLGGGGIGHGNTGYAERAPVDITFAFDSNEARRCVRVANTLYITGAEIMQYDGARLVECGWHIEPFTISLVPTGGGSMGAGTYAYKQTLRWDNAVGELDRSSSTFVSEVTMGAGNSMTMHGTKAVYVTHKTASQAAVEFWRTIANPVEDSPFYLVTSKDPANSTNPNRYIANDTTVAFDLLLPELDDDIVDADLQNLEDNPENDGTLENVCPPAATIIAANHARVFLAGVASDPHRVWYSKTRDDGKIVSFHDALVIDIPHEGGDITALAFLNETLIVFRQTAIYALPGDGFDNGSGGQNYGPPRILSSDVGALSAESVALTPHGLIFKSRKGGWYMLNRGWNVDYIGGPVVDYDSDEVYAVHVLESKHQVRAVTDHRVLVWDYLVNQWSEWTVSDGLHAAIWNGTYHYLTATGPKAEGSSYSSLTYGWDLETPWVKFNGLQGYGACRLIELLGEYRSAFVLRVRVARDYEYDGSGNPAWFQDKVWTPDQTTVGSILQVQHAPSKPITQAIKIRLTAYATLTAATFNAASSFTSGGTVATSGAAWSGVLTSSVQGTDGNGVTLSVYTSDGDAGIEVRDHQSYNGSTWSTAYNTVGVRVGTGTWTVADLETAINDQSRLASVTTADATPTKTITDTNTSHSGLFTGGAQTYPTGEAAKLTGLGLEVGIRRGLNKRLSAAQRQ